MLHPLSRHHVSKAGRYFRTDLRRSVKSNWIAIAVLTLSFLGPVVSSILRSSVESFLSSNSRRILTADLAITAYRPIREDEVDRIRTEYGVKREVREIEFVTMAVGREERGNLLEVHAVEPKFPIDGEFQFADGTKGSGGPMGESVWLSSDAALALGLSRSDKLKLGRLEFNVEKIIQQAPGISRAAFGFAPRAYIPIDRASSTGLLGFGSQIYHRVYLETSRPAPADEVKEKLGDPDLFLRTPDDSVQGLERFTGFVSLYLAVVSVSLFALGWAAAFYIIRTQAIERMRQTAIAMVFGGTRRSMLQFEFLRTLAVTVIAAFTALAIARVAAEFLEPVIAAALSKNVPGVFQISMSIRDFSGLFLTAIVSALLFTLPFALRLQKAQPRELFDDSALAPPQETRADLRATAVMLAIGFATLTALAAWITRDAKRGLQLAAGFGAATIVIHFAGVLVFRQLASSFRKVGKSAFFRLVGLQLSRARFAVRLSFLAIGLSTFVSSGVGQIMISLGDELGSGGRLDSAPDFFLFNIPESEVESLQNTVGKFGIQLDFLSPMILARLQAKNGEGLESEQFRKFPVRITWREKPIASEKILEGDPLPEKFNEAAGRVPLLSVESRFAERNDLAIGDRLSFDVQGVPIEGEVGNLRQVRWTDFNPNFFISFQGGVLEDAPKTWLANIRAKDRSQRPEIQAEIVRKFPDLSIIDVSQTLEKIVALMRAILGPAEFAAWLASLFSVFVLVTVVVHSTVLRAHEMTLFRVLGAEPHRVRWLYRTEFALASGLGSLIGASGGLVLAWFVSTRFLDLEFRPDIVRFLITIFVGLTLGTLLGEWLYRRTSRGLGFERRVV
jgi:putative ABC transport system permease protein